MQLKAAEKYNLVEELNEKGQGEASITDKKDGLMAGLLTIVHLQPRPVQISRLSTIILSW